MTSLLANRRARATSTRRARLAPGFTLTEILIAIALIVTIVGVAVANLGSLFTSGQEQTAKIFVTSEIDTPLMVYRTHTGSYPSTEQGLRALYQQPDGVSGWKGSYLKNPEYPVDPWKTPYNYQFPGVHNTSNYDVWSAGPDKQSGTADDIGNWSSTTTP